MNALIYFGIFMMYLGFRIMNGWLNEPSYNSHPYGGTYSKPYEESNFYSHHLSTKLIMIEKEE